VLGKCIAENWATIITKPSIGYMYVMKVHTINSMRMSRGGDLGGLGGRSSPKFEVGERPTHPFPNILRSSVVGCARKYEQSKKRCFSCEERVINDIQHSKEDTENLGKERGKY